VPGIGQALSPLVGNGEGVAPCPLERRASSLAARPLGVTQTGQVMPGIGRYFDYATGGRSFGPWYQAMSFLNTWLAGSVFIAFAGMVAGGGIIGYYLVFYSLLALALMFFMAVGALFTARSTEAIKKSTALSAPILMALHRPLHRGTTRRVLPRCRRGSELRLVHRRLGGRTAAGRAGRRHRSGRDHGQRRCADPGRQRPADQ
jgi:hypothetical protein